MQAFQLTVDAKYFFIIHATAVALRPPPSSCLVTWSLMDSACGNDSLKEHTPVENTSKYNAVSKDVRNFIWSPVGPFL